MHRQCDRACVHGNFLEHEPRSDGTEFAVSNACCECMQKTLLLCYPDDFENKEGVSVAAQCLQVLQSDVVVHCGELFGDTVSLDHAPWGRTTSADAQQHLFSLFR